MGRYAAFISYKHRNSSAFAYDLEYHLKRYARGFLRKPDRIFRDEQFLQPGDDLSEGILQALTDSTHLILLASPEAAASPWVQEELTIWCKELRRADQLIIVLTEGNIAVDDDQKRIRWEDTNAIPGFLASYLPKLPLFVDLSWATRVSDRKLSNPAFSHAINAIAAKIRNTTPNALNGLEWKIRRRNLLAAWGVAGLLFVFLVGFVLGFFVLRDTNRQLEASIALSRSRELAAKAQLQGIPEAFNSASESIKLDQNQESVNSVLTTLSQYQNLQRHIIQVPEPVEHLWQDPLRPDRFHLLSGQSLISWQGLGDHPVIDSIGVPGVLRVQQTATRELFGCTSNQLWRLRPRKELVYESDNFISTFAIDSLAQMAYLGQLDGKVRSVDLSNGNSQDLYGHQGQVNDIALLRGGGWVSTALSSTLPVVLYEQGQFRALPDPPFSANAATISANEELLAVAYESGEIGLYQLPELEEIWLESLVYAASEVAFHADDSLLAAGSVAGEVAIFDRRGVSLDGWQAVNGAVWELNWYGDSLLSAGSDGWVRLWKPNHILGTEAAYPGPFEAMSFTKDQRALAITHDLHVYDLYAGEPISAFDLPGFRVAAMNANGIVLHQGDSIYYISHAAGSLKRFPATTKPHTLRPKSFQISEGAQPWVIVSWWSKTYTAPGGISVWNTETDEVTWLEAFPEYPDVMAVRGNEYLAAYGSGTVYVWNLQTREVISQSEANRYAPIQEMAFLSDEWLALGHLMSSLELVRTTDVNEAVYRTEIVTGSNYGLEVLGDTSVLSIDVDGVKWFDHELNYLGTLVNSEKRSFASALEGAGDHLLILLRRGSVAKVKVNLPAWGEYARQVGTPRIEYDSLVTYGFQ